MVPVSERMRGWWPLVSALEAEGTRVALARPAGEARVAY